MAPTCRTILCRERPTADRVYAIKDTTLDSALRSPTARHNRDIRQFAAAFYDAVLFALGYVRVWSDATAIGYGRAGSGDKLAIKLSAREVVAPGPGFHVAFSAPSREAVARFHATALKHGGQDNGAPGLRPEYGENYYAAFVIDPDGYRVEAVMDRGT